MNKYEIAYDIIIELQRQIVSYLIDETGCFDVQSVNVLSASYILQDYLAGKIAAIGESPEGVELDCIPLEYGEV